MLTAWRRLRRGRHLVEFVLAGLTHRLFIAADLARQIRRTGDEKP